MIDTIDTSMIFMPDNQQIARSPLLNLLQKIDAICVLCSESSDTQTLLSSSLQKTLDLLRAQHGSIFVLDQQTKELTLKASVGMKADEGRSSGSFISSPLMSKGENIGVINIFDKIPSGPFTQRESQLLNFLSNQIALNYQRISMTDQLGLASAETMDLKKKIESQERLVSLGKLAGGIAHDFNNPLDGVMRYTNLCLNQVQDNEVLREYLMEIQLGLKRMANIVRNLLACARQSPGSIYKVDIHKPIEQALKEVAPYLASKNINLVRNFSKNIPEVTDWGIERIISNLLKNAIDAIDKNGTIEISTVLDDGFIDLIIFDTGRGIADDDLGRIFEPFFTTKDIDQGCGLGLTVVNEIVKCYDGKIKVKSDPGHGTTFTVQLPVTK